MKALKIVQVPDKLLQKELEPVTKIDDAFLKKVRQMVKTMALAEGIGLSANQVGWDQRLFIIATKCLGMGDKLAAFSTFTGGGTYGTLFPNPQLVTDGEFGETRDEGCLSIPGRKFRVLRSTSVRIRTYNVHGLEIETTLLGTAAQVFQHEYDHVMWKTIEDKGEEVSGDDK